MNVWYDVCALFARREKAKLSYVEEKAFGIEYPNGVKRRIGENELIDILCA